MLKIKVLFLIFATVNVAYATLGSDLDEDDFRSLKGVENDGEDDENNDDLIGSAEEQNDEEDSRVFYNQGPDPNTLEHENLEEFEKLRSNPPFPVSDDEMDEVSIRKKRSARKNQNMKVKPIKKKRKNKMDETIRDGPDSPDNSKFQGMNL